MGGQRFIVASIALAGLGCPERGPAMPDAAIDGNKSEGSSALTLVIAVTGCAPYEPAGDCGPNGDTAPCCRGAPPLALSFAPVGSPELTRFKWSFGDNTATTTERAPSHVYAYPGKYQVTLIGDGNDIGMPDPDPLYVVVASLPAGAPCDIEDQCGAGLMCLCAPGSGCSPAFTRGFCSMACDTAVCGANAVCAAPALDVSAGAAAALCLAACQTSAQCAPGYVCQTLPARSTTAAATPWTRGCLPLGAMRDLGGSCRDANEVLADDTCATGLCADVGALGVCSATCDDSHPCPDEATCTRLADGRQLCLAGCTTGVDCDRDPLLACAPEELMSNVTVCAPKRCTGDAVCAPSGRCGPDGVCVRK